MSKKQNAQHTAFHLRMAHAFISHAQDSAKESGDNNLHQKVTKLRSDIIEIRKDLENKLFKG